MNSEQSSSNKLKEFWIVSMHTFNDKEDANIYADMKHQKVIHVREVVPLDTNRTFKAHVNEKGEWYIVKVKPNAHTQHMNTEAGMGEIESLLNIELKTEEIDKAYLDESSYLVMTWSKRQAFEAGARWAIAKMRGEE